MKNVFPYVFTNNILGAEFNLGAELKFSLETYEKINPVIINYLHKDKVCKIHVYIYIFIFNLILKYKYAAVCSSLH